MDVENTQGTEEQAPKVKAAKVGDTIQPKKVILKDTKVSSWWFVITRSSSILEKTLKQANQ